MKKILSIGFVFLLTIPSNGQENEYASPTVEEALENLMERSEEDTNDENWQLLDFYLKNPLDLNQATEEQLEEMQLLTALQIKNLTSYRRLLGAFLSIYELQAIPAWDLQAIRRLLPYIKVGLDKPFDQLLIKRFKGGANYLLLRASQQIEKSKGFEKPKDSLASHYLGNPQRLFFRYRYQYKNLLQYGILGDKDAGEPFFKGAQKYGFDFYSFHFFSKNMGIIKSLALGDFTVNMGQGLIQWQGFAFSKSSELLGIKRQAPILRPYGSAGEFNFHRGAGITLQKGAWQSTVFASFKHISANMEMDSLGRQDYFTSFQSIGYHRTNTEIADRNSLGEKIFGGNIGFKKNQYQMGANAVYYDFSKPLQKRDLPYNLFSVQGSTWSNESIDYSITFRNLHFFGEAAIDKNLHTAFVNGALLSLSSRLDISFLHRKIDKAYQSFYSNAFTENVMPNNESGFFMGIAFRPRAAWDLRAFFDLYSFPWLKYLVDAPSKGKEYFLQIGYRPNKIWMIDTRYKITSKWHDYSGSFDGTKPLGIIRKQSWKTGIFLKLNPSWELRNRLELIWLNKNKDEKETGFLGLMDIFYKPKKTSVNGSVRIQYFETDGYDSRIYAYENDVPYSYSIPVFFDKGVRYYLNLHFGLKRMLKIPPTSPIRLDGWLRWAQTIYSDKSSLGTGLDMIKGNRKSEIKVQWVLGW